MNSGLCCCDLAAKQQPADELQRERNLQRQDDEVLDVSTPAE